MTDGLKAINHHIEFYKHQNEQYAKDINDLDHKTCVLVIDFKENFKVGGGRIETNSCFYEKTPISLLGFAAIFKENNEIRYEYHNFLSEILSHDSLFAGQCLIELLKNNKFRRIRNLKVWTDNGNHFRSYEFLHYLFKEAPKSIKGVIKFNRFVECHGKSIVDGHFGVLSRLFKQKEMERDIKNLSDLKSAFEDEEARKNASDSLTSNSIIAQRSFFYVYNRSHRPIKKSLEVKALHTNLSYFMKDDELYASPLTFDNISNYSKVDFQLKSSNDIRETRRSEPPKTLVGHVHEVGRISRGQIFRRVISVSKMTSFFSSTN